MILNDYLICLRCTRGSTMKMTVQLGGAAPDVKIPLLLMTKGGEIYQMQRTEVWFQKEHEQYKFSIA